MVRSGYARQAYPSDISDDEWAVAAPHMTLIKDDAPQREHSLREVLNGLRTLCPTAQVQMPPTAQTFKQVPKAEEARESQPSLDLPD